MLLWACKVHLWLVHNEVSCRVGNIQVQSWHCVIFSSIDFSLLTFAWQFGLVLQLHRSTACIVIYGEYVVTGFYTKGYLYILISPLNNLVPMAHHWIYVGQTGRNESAQSQKSLSKPSLLQKGWESCFLKPPPVNQAAESFPPLEIVTKPRVMSKYLATEFQRDVLHINFEA